MLRSLYSAVSGIKGHQTYLDVTGNNIANVNTTGFKKDSLLFADAIYQTMKSASAPNSGVPIGGVNPAQVGLGVTVAAIETIHSQGSLQNTGQSTDMAIDGKGFFVLRNGSQQVYTRSGAFALDKNGNLVQQGNGYLVQGYAYKDRLNPATGNVERVKDTSLTNINIPMGEKIPAKATQLASFRCNLCSTEAAEIPDVKNNIPGGVDRVLRPHEYTAYGSPKHVDNFGPPPGGGAIVPSGVTYYDPATNTLYTGDGVTVPAVATPADATTIYHGTNPDAPGAGEFSEIYYTGDDAHTGPVAARAVVDQVGIVAPTVAPAVTPSKPGAIYLDRATGTLYTANATGTGWLPTTSTAKENTAYAVKGSLTVYMFDSTTNLSATPPTVNAMVDVTAAVPVMDPQNSNNLFAWDDANDTWKNVNLDFPPATSLFANNQSVTTQANIDAFGESMLLSNDWVDKMTVYDSLGNPQTLEVAFRRVFTKPADPKAVPPTAAETEWDWYAYYTDKDGKVLGKYGEGAGTLVFGDDGLLKRTYYYEPTPATPDPAATAATQPEYNWTVVEKIIGDPAYESVATGKVVADFNIDGAQGSVVDGVPVTYESNTITLDFLGKQYADLIGIDHDTIDGVTSFASTSTTKMRYQDGYPMGVLNNFSTGQDGTIMGVYSNGVLLPVAQVALATFQNDQGLEKIGGTYFVETANSGLPDIGGPMEGSAGSIVANNLEMSNVDLSEEFVSLIRAQRGFQANSRVVTTSDQVLEELINLKR